MLFWPCVRWIEQQTKISFVQSKYKNCWQLSIKNKIFSGYVYVLCESCLIKKWIILLLMRVRSPLLGPLNILRTFQFSKEWKERASGPFQRFQSSFWDDTRILCTSFIVRLSKWLFWNGGQMKKRRFKLMGEFRWHKMTFT